MHVKKQREERIEKKKQVKEKERISNIISQPKNNTQKYKSKMEKNKIKLK